MLLHLSQRIAWKFIHDDELARHFECRQLFAATAFEVRCVDLPQDNYVGYRNFSTYGVGRCGYSRFRNLFLLLKKLLDLSRINIEAAGDDQVAPASAQRVVTIGRTYRQVASAEIAVEKGGARGFVPFPVTGENIWPFEMDFTGFVIGYRLAAFVEEQYRDTGHRQAHASRPAIAKIGVAHVHECFAHAVALQNAVPKLCAELFEDLGGQRCRAGDKQAHPGADFAGLLERSIEKPNVHGRHSENSVGWKFRNAAAAF